MSLVLGVERVCPWPRALFPRPLLNKWTDIFAVGKVDYGVMVRYQNLTRKPELFRALGTMYPLNPPLTVPAYQISFRAYLLIFYHYGLYHRGFQANLIQLIACMITSSPQIICDCSLAVS